MKVVHRLTADLAERNHNLDREWGLYRVTGEGNRLPTASSRFVNVVIERISRVFIPRQVLYCKTSMSVIEGRLVRSEKRYSPVVDYQLAVRLKTLQ